VSFDGADLSSIHQGGTKRVDAESYICALGKSAQGEASRELLLGEIQAAAERAADRDEALEILETALRIMQHNKRQWLRTELGKKGAAGKKP
jgi:hypothetical protein